MTVQKKPSIMGYVRQGHRAIEKRLAQIEAEIEAAKRQLVDSAKLGLRLSKSLNRYVTVAPLRRLLPRAFMAASSVGRRTLEELHAEREALQAFLGNHLRRWEVTPAGPAPI